MSTEAIAKVACITMFLLFAYFMIGSYTPCNPTLNRTYHGLKEISPFDPYEKNYDYDMSYNTKHIDNKYTNNELNKVTLPIKKYNDNRDKNIYQRGPYINF